MEVAYSTLIIRKLSRADLMIFFYFVNFLLRFAKVVSPCEYLLVLTCNWNMQGFIVKCFNLVNSITKCILAVAFETLIVLNLYIELRESIRK